VALSLIEEVAVGGLNEALFTVSRLVESLVRGLITEAALLGFFPFAFPVLMSRLFGAAVVYMLGFLYFLSFKVDLFPPKIDMIEFWLWIPSTPPPATILETSCV